VGLTEHTFELVRVTAVRSKTIVGYFLDKEYILISKRYQIHLISATTQCPNGETDAHSQLEEEIHKKRKVPL
jgi:hypothetical protein